jgi:RimJ/RimL family protein N-acetyltransferase
MRIRPATAADARLLLEWANDPGTRAAGFHPQPIDAATHGRWLAQRLASPSSRLLIGVAEDHAVGQVRLDGEADGRVEVGIAVAPDARGRGVGRDLLAAALGVARADPGLDARFFVARIRPDNVASIALFAGAGFHFADRTECNGVPCLVYELAV